MTLSVLPSSADVLAGTPSLSGKPRLSNATGPSFGTIVKKKVADASTATDANAQLAALLQNGTPLSTIVDTIVKAAAKGANLTPAQTARLRTALAPPGTAPPDRPAAEQVAALVRRLQTVLNDVARGTETVPAGQQNDIAGNILDAAATAKDIPAQAQTAPTTTPVDLGSLVQSILDATAAQLQSSSGVAVSVPQPQSQPAATAPAAPPSAPGTDASPGRSTDLLSRILTRAIDGTARVEVATGTRSAASNSAGTAATFARLIATAERAAQSGSGSRNAFGSPLDRDSAKAGVASKQTDGSSLAAFGLPGADPRTADAASATSTGPAPYTTVDPEAILSQILKGIAVRSIGDGVHQMQLHLQPAHLGSVTLDLRVDGSSVSASVVAQNGDVRDALVSNQHHLARSFADAGMKLASFSVDVSGGDARGFQQGQNNAQGFGRRYVVHETAGADETDASVAGTSSTSSNGSLDLLDQLA
jgi:flagellar hook-length control protein FliK